MDTRQRERLSAWCAKQQVDEFHHGDCVGADEQAHDVIVTQEGVTIVIHPHNSPVYIFTKSRFIWNKSAFTIYMVWRNIRCEICFIFKFIIQDRMFAKIYFSTTITLLNPKPMVTFIRATL